MMDPSSSAAIRRRILCDMADHPFRELSLSSLYQPCTKAIAQVGAINSFESASSSVYNGMTVSLKRQLSRGMFFRSATPCRKPLDDGPDALVVGRSGNVQNSYNTSAERSFSDDDQRHRFVAAWVAEPSFISTKRGSTLCSTIGNSPASSPSGQVVASMPSWRATPIRTATPTTTGCPAITEILSPVPISSVPTFASPAT